VSPDTLAFLAEASEGNLLAAKQELEKLALLLPAGTLDHDAVVDAVADVARYDVAALSEAWLGGEGARAVRILSVLRDEGESPVLPVWQLSEDVHALAIVQGSLRRACRPATRCARRACGAGAPPRWSARRRACRATSRRRSCPCSRGSTRLSKGLGRADPWDELAAAALLVAGTPTRPSAQVAVQRLQR
jgi:DNA polymerase-3 subunit delta